MGKSSKTHFCKCSRDCKAVVKTAGKLYAHGHNPNGRNREVDRLRREMTADEYAKYSAKRREELGPYAAEKRLVKCQWCDFEDGVRAVQRHRAECEKSPRRSPEAWSDYIKARYRAKKSPPKAA
jgi:hypothetical protein